MANPIVKPVAAAVQKESEAPEPDSVLFEVSAPYFQALLPNGKRVYFGKNTKYRTSDPVEIAYLTAESKTGDGIIWIPEDQDQSVEPLPAPGSNVKLREQQLREFLQKQAPLVMPDSKSGLHAVSTAESPLTGGQSPASARYTQQETIAALKGVKVVSSK